MIIQCDAKSGEAVCLIKRKAIGSYAFKIGLLDRQNFSAQSSRRY